MRGFLRRAVPTSAKRLHGVWSRPGTFLLAATLCWSASPAAADIVYDNGVPSTPTHLSTAPFISLGAVADDFTLASSTMLTGAQVYLGHEEGLLDEGPLGGPLNWYIFNDGGGVPGSVAASGQATPTITHILRGSDPDTDRPYWIDQLATFDFGSPFLASDSRPYWFGIEFAGTNGHHLWMESAANSTGERYRVAQEAGDVNFTWSFSGGQGAFALVGSVAAPGSVPEPSTWAMMILGFGAMGISMRSAKRRKAALVAA